MNKPSRNIYNYICYLIMCIGSIIRIIYISFTDCGVRQHDLGYATQLNDGLINPGHLGYIEYIVKFGHLPDFDPFSIFSYYHPPVHHVLAAMAVKSAYALGYKEPLCYEAIQIVTCVYGCLTIFIAYKILKLLTSDTKYIILPLALISFHPGLIYMSGSVNNDMMATLFIFLCVYTTLLWIRSAHKLMYLIMMALSIGIGMIIKLNVIVIAFPMGIVMLLHMINMVKNGQTLHIIKQYLIFLFISMPIGLSWTLRGIIKFHIGPGISSASPESNQYIGSYSLFSRLGLPASSAIKFPFHSENASFCHNIWQILFKTALFTEIWPDNISPAMLLLCQIVYFSSIILAILLSIIALIKAVQRIKNGDNEAGYLLLSGYPAVLISYLLFVIKYPYTCSCDFRYIAVSLLFISTALIPSSLSHQAQ